MMERATINVMYSCHDCGLIEVNVSVPGREQEDVLEWIETMGACLSSDHAKRSPNCNPISLHDIKIPMAGADRIGGAVVN